MVPYMDALMVVSWYARQCSLSTQLRQSGLVGVQSVAPYSISAYIDMCITYR